MIDLRAMTSPAAKGERFIACAGPGMWMVDIARVLRAALPEVAKKVPTRQIPGVLVRLFGRVSPQMRTLVPLLDETRNATSVKAERLLGWKARPREETIVATAESLVKLGVAHSATRTPGTALAAPSTTFTA